MNTLMEQGTELATHMHNDGTFYMVNAGKYASVLARLSRVSWRWIYSDCTTNEDLNGPDFVKLDGNKPGRDELPASEQESTCPGESMPFSSEHYTTSPKDFGTIPDDKPLFTQEVEMRIGGGKSVPEVYKAGRFAYQGVKYSIFVTEDGKEYSRKNSKIKTRPIDNRTDKQKLIGALADAFDGWTFEEFSNYNYAKILLESDKFTITLKE